MLTLTATPIPRTLQLALSGVRELSLITTPPVDRLAVRTYISPFDPVIIREALRRERYRGGQSFYVVPRISDLEDVAEFLAEQTPELRVGRAHGQLAPSTLEDVMTAFYDGKYDVLLSTAIVESGLDIPNANTLIVHRADMFGLAQLYQLRGRVGRSKTRAYAYFTTPNEKLSARRGTSAQGAAVAGHAGRGLLAGEPRAGPGAQGRARPFRHGQPPLPGPVPHGPGRGAARASARPRCNTRSTAPAAARRSTSRSSPPGTRPAGARSSRSSRPITAIPGSPSAPATRASPSCSWPTGRTSSPRSRSTTWMRWRRR